MKKILILLLLALMGRQLSAQNTAIQITFRLVSEVLSEDATVYATGSHEKIGNWNPAGLQLHYIGNSTWTNSFLVDQPVNLEYKFTLGTWESEAANAEGVPLPNFRASVTSSQTLTHQIGRWTDGSPQTITGQITGTVRYHRGIAGAGLQHRDVIVWLPSDYEENPVRRYPVLYMHDGQNVFDPATSAFGVDWAVDESMDSLIRAGHLGSMIVVGIYNTSDRMYEYTPGKKGDAYMQLVTKTIKPLMDSTYRTLPDRATTFVGGSSAGGIISFMLVWTYPDIFSGALCLSPAFKSPPDMAYAFDFVKVVRETQKRENVSFYLDNVGVGLEAILQPGIDEMVLALEEKGYQSGTDYVLKLDPTASHQEAAWARRFPAAFLWLVGR